MGKDRRCSDFGYLEKIGFGLEMLIGRAYYVENRLFKFLPIVLFEFCCSVVLEKCSDVAFGCLLRILMNIKAKLGMR